MADKINDNDYNTQAHKDYMKEVFTGIVQEYEEVYKYINEEVKNDQNNRTTKSYNTRIICRA